MLIYYQHTLLLKQYSPRTTLLSIGRARKISATPPIEPTQATHDEVARVRGVLHALEAKFEPHVIAEDFARAFAALARKADDED